MLVFNVQHSTNVNCIKAVKFYIAPQEE